MTWTVYQWFLLILMIYSYFVEIFVHGKLFMEQFTMYKNVNKILMNQCLIVYWNPYPAYRLDFEKITTKQTEKTFLRATR